MRRWLHSWVGMTVLVLAPVARGDLGSITFDIQSGGSNGPAFVSVDGVNDATVPVSVFFSTSPSGSTGSNRGASTVVFTLSAGVPLIDQMPMTLAQAFVNAANLPGSSTDGAGFDSLASPGSPADSTPLDGDPTLDLIESVGGSQGISPSFTMGSKGKQGPDLEFAGHFAPILIADGLINVAKNTPEGTYLIQVIAGGGSVWDHTPGAALQVAVPTSGDSLMLVVTAVPEPATLALLGPIAMLIKRRKR